MNSMSPAWVIGWLLVAGPGVATATIVVTVIWCRRTVRREAEARRDAYGEWLASDEGERWYATADAREPQ